MQSENCQLSLDYIHLVISENIIEISCEPVGLAGTFELPKTSDKQNFPKPCKIF